MNHPRAIFLLLATLSLTGLLTQWSASLKMNRRLNTYDVGVDVRTQLPLFNPVEGRLVASPDRLSPFDSMPLNVSVALDLIRKARHAKDQRATFVQIGANDGVFQDPLYEPMKPFKDSWFGLLVEPQPELHEKLVTLHQDSDWTFFNGVFAPNCGFDGTIPFCETTTPGQGGWKTQGQTNSLDLAQCENGKLRNKFRLVHHPCEGTFGDLIRNHGNPEMIQQVLKGSLDFLQIDAEGHDFELLQAIRFDTMLVPQCIHYEHRHLWGKRKKTLVFLKGKGYTTRKLGMNTLACLVAPQSSATQTK
jgi:hypothetical protein